MISHEEISGPAALLAKTFATKCCNLKVEVSVLTTSKKLSSGLKYCNKMTEIRHTSDLMLDSLLYCLVQFSTVKTNLFFEIKSVK